VEASERFKDGHDMATALAPPWLASAGTWNQGCFYAMFRLGLTCVVSCSVVGRRVCKRRAELFRAIQFCTAGQWRGRIAFYDIVAQ
jgi:hypothetical protein